MLHRFQITKRFLAMFLAVIFLFTGTLLGFPGQARAYNDVCNDSNQGEIAENTTVLATTLAAAGGTIALITAKGSLLGAAAAWATGTAGIVLAAPVAVGVAAGGLTYLAWETLHPNIVAKANLPGADLHGANLSGKDLSEICLAGANLQEAKLNGTILKGANLTGANLSNADLTSANLTNTDLAGANLSNADLTSADLTGANTSLVKSWDGAKLIGVKGLR